MNDDTGIDVILPAASAGERLDAVLGRMLPEYSRSRIQAWLRAGQIQVDGASPRASVRIRGGEQVQIRVPAVAAGAWLAEPVPLRIVREDDAILVIDKPAGLLTHPGAGHANGTLVNGVLQHVADNQYLPRGGIVHRLDKDTTGLLVVAKTEAARQSLIAQLASRSMHREYLALVLGAMTGGGTVDAPIGRHSHDRLRMTVRSDGRPAQTDYRLAERFARHTLLRLRLATGRTHQIRVHMAHIGHPLLGDPLYGGGLRMPAGASPALVEALRGFQRQALHAERLAFTHPFTAQAMTFEAPLPDDLTALLNALRTWSREADHER